MFQSPSLWNRFGGKWPLKTPVAKDQVCNHGLGGGWWSLCWQHNPRDRLWTECLCPLKIHTLKPCPPKWWYQEVQPLRRYRIRWGHEGRSLMNGISALLKSWQSFCMLSLSLFLMWGHSKEAAICKPGRGLSPEPSHTGTWLPTSGDRTNKFLLLKPPSLCYFVMTAWAD